MAARKSKTPSSAQDAIKVNEKISEVAFEDIIKIPKNWSKEDDVETDVAVEYMILAIGKVSTYSEFLNPEILQTMTETVEYILRIDGIIELIIESKEKRKDFADAIGNLLI